MFKNLMLVLTITSSLTLINTQSVSANEGKIRQAGNNRIVYGQLNGEVRFTVAGRLTDMVTVELGNGTHFARLSIRDLKNSPLSVGSYVGSGGDTVVRVRISNAQPRFNRGRVLIHRGSHLIDGDRVILR